MIKNELSAADNNNSIHASTASKLQMSNATLTAADVVAADATKLLKHNNNNNNNTTNNNNDNNNSVAIADRNYFRCINNDDDNDDEDDDDDDYECEDDVARDAQTHDDRIDADEDGSRDFAIDDDDDDDDDNDCVDDERQHQHQHQQPQPQQLSAETVAAVNSSSSHKAATLVARRSLVSVGKPKSRLSARLAANQKLVAQFARIQSFLSDRLRFQDDRLNSIESNNAQILLKLNLLTGAFESLAVSSANPLLLQLARQKHLQQQQQTLNAAATHSSSNNILANHHQQHHNAANNNNSHNTISAANLTHTTTNIASSVSNSALGALSVSPTSPVNSSPQPPPPHHHHHNNNNNNNNGAANNHCTQTTIDGLVAAGVPAAAAAAAVAAAGFAGNGNNANNNGGRRSPPSQQSMSPSLSPSNSQSALSLSAPSPIMQHSNNNSTSAAINSTNAQSLHHQLSAASSLSHNPLSLSHAGNLNLSRNSHHSQPQQQHSAVAAAAAAAHLAQQLQRAPTAVQNALLSSAAAAAAANRNGGDSPQSASRAAQSASSVAPPPPMDVMQLLQVLSQVNAPGGHNFLLNAAVQASAGNNATSIPLDASNGPSSLVSAAQQSVGQPPSMLGLNPSATANAAAVTNNTGPHHHPASNHSIHLQQQHQQQQQHYQTVRTKYSTRRYSRRRVGPEEAMADPLIRETVELKMPLVPKTLAIVLMHRLTVQTAITLACANSNERLRKGAIQKKLEAMFREPGAVDRFFAEWQLRRVV